MPISDLAAIDQWVPAALLAALRPELADHRIHLVGGALRDRWLGRPVTDLDLVATGSAGDLGRRLARRLGGRFVDLAGERFAAYRVVAGDLTVDLWGRGETPMRAELARRDLTINALAVDLEDEAVLDPLRAADDLERRVLRACGERSFAEDPLRVLRLARFGAVLDGFRVAPPTLALARAAAAAIDRVADERMRYEVTLLLGAAGRAEGVGILTACGLRSRLWGGNEPGRRDDPTARLGDLEATAEGLLDRVPSALRDLDPLIVSHALLFAPPGGGGAAAAASPLLSRRQRQRVSRLLTATELPETEAEARWWLRRRGRGWAEAAIFARLSAAPAERAAVRRVTDRLASLAARHGADLFDAVALLDGDEVGRLLDLPPGPQIGRALAALEREQAAGRVSTPAAARRFLLSGRWRTAGGEDPSSPPSDAD